MVKNDVIQHYEEQGNFWFSEEGDIAAQNSNLMASWNIMRSDRSAIVLWMSGPFHGIGLIDPAMSMTGFGSYRETDPFGNISMSACLDILQGLDELSPDTKFPIMWPGEGRLIPYTSYTGSEWPDPLASCPGYNKPSEAPIYLQIGAGDMIPMVSDHTLSLDGVPLEHCLFDETTYSNPSDIDAQNLAFIAREASGPQRLYVRALDADTATLVPGSDTVEGPMFSPDGRWVAFVEGTGGTNRGDDLGDEGWLNVRVVGASGGEVRHVTETANRGANRRMPRPRWSADGRRILFQESDGGKTYLTSITTEGTDRRRLVENERAEEIVPSPDGRWVAFKELHNVYVAPLPAAGKDPVKIEASGAGVPVRELSRYGGDWLDWRPDGKSLTWVLGPAFYLQTLADAYAKPDTAAPG